MIELLSNTIIYSNIIKIANGNIYKSIVLYTIFNYDFIIIDYLYGFIHYMCDSVFFIKTMGVEFLPPLKNKKTLIDKCIYSFML